MNIYKLISASGILLLGLLGTANASNAWAGNSSHCKKHFQLLQYKEAFPACNNAAKHGDIESQFYLAKMYSMFGEHHNDEKAIRWYRKAAAHGHVESQEHLGIAYYYGLGVRKDNREAEKWFQKVAKLGNADAQYHLGLIYSSGNGIKKNYNEAAWWFKQAASHGNADAQFRLGKMYADGIGVERSGALAVDWLYKAGTSYLKAGKKEKALQCAELIKKHSSDTELTVPNAFLGDELLAKIYGKRKKETNRFKVKPRISTGTGWPVSAGYIVTNHHVIAGHHRITLIRKDGTQITATVAARDTTNDLALLKPVSLKKIPPALPIAKNPNQVGTPVFTIGYPHPNLMGIEPKLTRGIINAMTGIANDPRTYQISVPLQGGNSGGPLVNMHGEVLGVVASKLSASKVLKWTGDLPQNVNYAIKSKYVLSLLSSVNSSNNIPVLPRAKATLPTLAKRLENSVVMIIAK